MTACRTIAVRVAVLLALAALVHPAESQAKPAAPTGTDAALQVASDWHASVVHDAGVGVWTVKALPVYDRFGCPEIVGLDDKGRCTVLIGYSGNWSAVETVHDGQWLGGIAHADLDLRRPGLELYTGGQRGRLYQIHQRPEGGFETRIAADFPGEEIHTLVGGALGPPGSRPVLLVFLGGGGAYGVRARPAPEGGFEVAPLGRLPGRVRDAVVLEAEPGRAPWIATVSRAGEVALCRMAGQALERRVIAAEPMGFGRLARRPPRDGAPDVLYASRDDGVVVRLEREDDSRWKREIIYAGPQGPRGLVAGRFHADPAVEAVAVFGYSRKVQIVSHQPGGPWQVETVFTDADRGHWLAAAELDGRNDTDEILGAGYGGRIFLLARPPGYGRPGVPVDPAESTGTGREMRAETPRGPAPIRVVVQSRPAAPEDITPLRYGGAFEPKALLYETLVRRDETGRIVPGLAGSWSIEEGGRGHVLELRPGARFHDGTPVTAEAVALHFRRWVGLPEHGWLGAARRIREVRALGNDRVHIRLDRPYALLPDLCALNPCAIAGPGSRNRHGTFVRPIGSGPFRFLGADDGGHRLHFARFRHGVDAAADRGVELVHVTDDPVAALLRGDVDLLAEGWATRIPRWRLPDLLARPAIRVIEAFGSAVVHLNLNFDRAALRDRELRRFLAAAVDREALVREVEHGRAVPCRALFAPSLEVWPASSGTPELQGRPPALSTPLVLIARSSDAAEARLAEALGKQLLGAGLAVEIRALDDEAHRAALAAGRWDLSLDRTWGLPYDPYITLVARFLPGAGPSAGSHKQLGTPAELAALVEEATRHASLEARCAIYRRIQGWLDREAIVVPLYCPHRLAAFRADLPAPALGPDLYRLELSSVTDSF
ncbi:MAG: hypothetical protein JXQ29_14545 [Planctomycetes bacterium]|nr:hypothetical protein [Planctomycetota bacterium]